MEKRTISCCCSCACVSAHTLSVQTFTSRESTSTHNTPPWLEWCHRRTQGEKMRLNERRRKIEAEEQDTGFCVKTRREVQREWH